MNIVLLAFNRPTSTERLLSILKSQEGIKNIFAVLDGARPQKEGEALLCEKVFQQISSINKTNVEILKSETNLGCAKRVSSGLDWVFNKVENAIILEDDCLPDPPFFHFCSTLLKRYEDDPRVAAISGFNPNPLAFSFAGSYFASEVVQCWGWATWKRAWQDFRFDMDGLDALLERGWPEGIVASNAAAEFWRQTFKKTKEGSISSWAYRWAYQNLVRRRIYIVPNKSMVANVGFSADATHTKVLGWRQKIWNRSARSKSPLKHPRTLETSILRDRSIYYMMHGVDSPMRLLR